ncbi:MAG TPA: 6-bladed beta-propeller [Longimicrobium sp.]|nr:6-bladed beta-propeller [Longimicrobium sp.]
MVDVGIDGLGRIWVADGMQQQIKVFRQDGTLVRSIGRKGAGPAEFGDLAGFDWAPDGTLWVVDGGNARFAVFDTAGNLTQTRPRTSTLSISPWPGAVDGEGRLADVAAGRDAQGQRRDFVLRFSPDGGPVDTLHLPVAREEVFGEITRGTPTNRSVKRAPVPFLGMPLWALDPEGYAWVGMTDRYRLERRRFDGSVERVLELENTPPQVTRADREQILRNYRWFEEQGGKLDASRIPATHPDLLNLFFDDERHLWVLPTYRFQQKPAIDVFNLDGRYLGAVQSPVSIGSHPAPVIRNGLLAAVASDPDGVESIVLMRIDRPGR